MFLKCCRIVADLSQNTEFVLFLCSYIVNANFQNNLDKLFAKLVVLQLWLHWVFQETTRFLQHSPSWEAHRC